MKIKIYGFSHSPWVQAVLLGISDKKIDYKLYQIPPLEVFKRWGVYMPAVSFNDEGKMTAKLKKQTEPKEEDLL